MWRRALSATTSTSLITRARTATVLNVRDRQHVTGWPHEPGTRCLWNISTWSSRCRPRSPVPHIGTSAPSMACCSASQPRQYRPSPQTPTSRRTCWYDQHAPHLGLGSHASPTHSHDRSGRWVAERRQSLGRMQAKVFSTCAGVIAVVSMAFHRRFAHIAPRGKTVLLR